MIRLDLKYVNKFQKLQKAVRLFVSLKIRNGELPYSALQIMTTRVENVRISMIKIWIIYRKAEIVKYMT